MSIRSCKGDFENAESSRVAPWLMSVWDATAMRKKASPNFIYACDLSLVVGKRKRKKKRKNTEGGRVPAFCRPKAAGSSQLEAHAQLPRISSSMPN